VLLMTGLYAQALQRDVPLTWLMSGAGLAFSLSVLGLIGLTRQARWRAATTR
jgi:hypothetical protein